MELAVDMLPRVLMEDSAALCSDNASNYSERCSLPPAEGGILSAVALVRVVTSCLGFLGSGSIIVSAVVRRRVCSSEVHPIFMLSLADLLLALLWVAGAAIWLAGTDFDRVYCYMVTLTTAIMECVALNLILVYAVIAYLRVRKTEVQRVGGALVPYGQFYRPTDANCKISLFLYFLSWVLPVVVVLVLFRGVANFSQLKYVQNCTCWCQPTVINVLPLTRHFTNDTKEFLDSQWNIIITLVAILSFHYILVFILLLVLYFKILRKIRKLKQQHEVFRPQVNYGTMAVLVQGHSKARKRVLLFLTVFLLSGFFNLCCTVMLLPVLIIDPPYNNHSWSNQMVTMYITFLYLQSLTLPLSGFLNAIVYGWTRDDFVNVLTFSEQMGYSAEVINSETQGLDRSFTETLDDGDLTTSQSPTTLTDAD